MKAHNIIKSALALSLAIVAVSSCQEKINGGGFTKGELVKFSIGTDVADTKAVYSDVKNAAGTIERIDWEPGDLIRIYCGAVSEPEEKYSDYVVTEIVSNEGAVSKARIGHTSLGQLGLRWGEGPHTFYAVYPSPEDDGSVATGISVDPYADGGTKGSVAKSITGPTVKAKLPATQAVVGEIKNNTAAPDLKNMLMTAKSKTYTEASGITDEVFLSFIPLTTAVQFTITNQTGKDIKVKSVSLISGNGKATAPAINGAFSVNLDSMSKPADIDLGASTITYSREYPACTRDASLEATTSMGLRTSTISFGESVPLTYNATADAAGKLTFTFFLTPTCNFDDITFKIVMTDSDGSNPRWMSTKLGYTDGTGVLIPRFKKSTITGVFVPEGAQWTIKYGPNVVSWNQSGSDIAPMPEVNEGTTLVTSWDISSPAEELELTDPYNGHEYVEIAGLKWATMNVGATSPKDYGYYFFWGGTEGYEYDSTNSKWVKASDHTTVLSGGFDWAQTPYQTGSSFSTGWTKYVPSDKSSYWSGTGDPDNKLVLDPEDDAAHVNWHGSWRMPTSAEFQALYDATYWALDATDKGYYVFKADATYTAGTRADSVPGDLNKADALLFFPAAGYGNLADLLSVGSIGRYWSSSLFSAGSLGRYWSSSLSSSYPYSGSNFDSTRSYVTPQGGEARNIGMPVRAVSDL